MPLQATVEIPERQRRALVRLLRHVRQGVPRVLSRAIRRTTDTVRSRIVKAVAGDVNVKQKDLYHRGGSTQPIVQRLIRKARFVVGGTVSVTGERIPLIRFGARQTRRGLTYKIARSGARKRIAGGFIPALPSGHAGGFRRVGRGRLPIMELFGPSIPQVAENRPEVQALIRVDAGRILQRETSRYADLMLRRAAARG